MSPNVSMDCPINNGTNSCGYEILWDYCAKAACQSSIVAAIHPTYDLILPLASNWVKFSGQPATIIF